MKEQVVRIGIVGVGSIGSAHAAAIAGGEIPHMTLGALCDSNPVRGDELRVLYPDIPVFDGVDAMLESASLDAVLIATPHYDHPPIAIKAFERGLHVLSEKPIGVYGAQAREMIAAARKSGKQFAVMFNQRTSFLYGKAREIVRSGALGELKRSVWIITKWYRKQSYYDSGAWRATWAGEGGGVLLNQAPHNLDLWQWICGMPQKIYARCDVGKYHDIEVEDDATVLATYENGATGIFITSTGDYPGTNRLEIVGSKGSLILEQKKLTWNRLAMDERDYRHSPKGTENSAEALTFEDQPIHGHREILKNFARAILFGDELIAKGEEGLCQLTLTNAAYLSAWTGKEISLPLDDETYLEALRERIDRSGGLRQAERDSSELGKYHSKWNTNW